MKHRMPLKTGLIAAAVAAMTSVVLPGSAAAADRATLICRLPGLVHDTQPAASMSCGGAMSQDCKRRFEQAMMQKYRRSDWYSAAKEICAKLPQRKGAYWYPHEIRVR